MKRTIVLLSTLLLISFNNILQADIAPIVRENFNISASDPNNHIRLLSEKVVVNLYPLSSKVECLFEMRNMGDSVTIEMGFPEMKFQQDVGPLFFNANRKISRQNADEYTISVNGKILDSSNIYFSKWLNNYLDKHDEEEEFIEEQRKKQYELEESIKVHPEESYSLQQQLDSLEQSYMKEYISFYSERSSILRTNIESQVPFYVWREHFDKGEKKLIKVSYEIPNGVTYIGDKKIGASNFLYFKYILSTGAGWEGTIGKVDIVLKISDGVDIRTIETVSPENYKYVSSSKKLSWQFNNLEPTDADNIIIIFYDVKSRKEVDNTFSPSSPQKTFRVGEWYRKKMDLPYPTFLDNAPKR
jgi:hypothetical protein